MSTQKQPKEILERLWEAADRGRNLVVSHAEALILRGTFENMARHIEQLELGLAATEELLEEYERQDQWDKER